MSVLVILFFAFLIYVSYFEIVSLLFRGKQSNRVFATLLCTIAPVFGSVPGIIIASKYERRVGGLAAKTNGYMVRTAITVLQMITVFMLFLPFFKSDGIYASGINVIYGLTVGGETIFKPVQFLSYIIYAPFVAAFINILDIRRNVRNIVSYTVSLILSLTMVLIALYVDIDASLNNTAWLWIYAILNVGIMLLSEISLVCVRNETLLKLEQEEQEIEELADNPDTKEQDSDTSVSESDETYKCSRCGNIIQKGHICECRGEKDSLSKILAASDDNESGDFCVYCHRKLENGEKCDCVGEGFGITIKPEHSERRKCQYCGQVLVGDSICVCEKIMKNSVPASPETDETDSKLYFKQQAKESEMKISDEISELERKINEQFSKVKDNLSNNKY